MRLIVSSSVLVLSDSGDGKIANYSKPFIGVFDNIGIFCFFQTPQVQLIQVASGNLSNPIILAGLQDQAMLFC